MHGSPATPSRTTLPLLACLAATSSACVVTHDAGSTLTVENDSSYVLTQLHVAKPNAPTWGPSYVPDVLYPGEAITIYDLPCNTYDVLVVDETGLDCPLYGLRLCFSDGYWSVTDRTLDVCAFEKRH